MHELHYRGYRWNAEGFEDKIERMEINKRKRGRGWAGEARLIDKMQGKRWASRKQEEINQLKNEVSEKRHCWVKTGGNNKLEGERERLQNKIDELEEENKELRMANRLNETWIY